MKLAQRIRHLRYAKGWGPDDLANRANISRTALYQIESGKTGLPRAATLRRIARALGVSPENLLSEQGELPSVEDTPAEAPVSFARPVLNVPVMGEMPEVAPAAPNGWLRDFELERKFRVLLNSPLRDAVARIVEETYRLLPEEARDLA